MNGFATYWDSVSHNLCIDCNRQTPVMGKRGKPSRRCADCLERVAEYNKNRRGQGIRTTPTPLQLRKATIGLLQMTQNAKEDVEAWRRALKEGI